MNASIFSLPRADQLAEIRAEVKRLQALEKDLAEALKAGADPIGLNFRATVISSDRDSVDWKAVAAKLRPSRQLVTAHTRHSTVVSVRVSKIS
jgi:hypothetical protein